MRVGKNFFTCLFWIYIITLTIYSIIPTGDLSEKVRIVGFELRLDYWLHLGAYFGVAFLFILSRIEQFVSKPKFFFWGIIFCSIYAYLTELIQFFVPGRTYNIYDFVANISGVSIAFMLFFLLKARLRQLQLKFVKA